MMQSGNNQQAESAGSAERNRLRQISLQSISNITNSQVNEIEQRLKQETEQKNEILNSASSNRNSMSPEANSGKSKGFNQVKKE